MVWYYAYTECITEMGNSMLIFLTSNITFFNTFNHNNLNIDCEQ